MLIRSSFLVCGLALLGVGCSGDKQTTGQAGSQSAAASDAALDPNKVKIEDVKVGKGDPAQVGDTLSVTYTGTLDNGAVFDSNVGKEPFPVVLGRGGVIAGWEQGLPGMKEGGERKLTIPSKLGYGSKGSGKIPPDATLHFDVTLLTLTKKQDMDTILVNDKKVGSGPVVKKGSAVTIKYSASSKGAVFDSQTISFKAGQRDVVPGISLGIVGMKQGGERVLDIPFMLAPKSPSAAPGAPVRVDVTLLSVK